jgi:predicted DCC family thiol-disulfide oxidoreductase YuxK
MDVHYPIILYDGICNLCNRSVRFIIRHDKKKVFRFASLQSEFGRDMMKRNHIDNPESVILIEKDKLYRYSTAALKIAGKMPITKWMVVFLIIPVFIRDGIYKWIARNRYKWFGKNDLCILPEKP